MNAPIWPWLELTLLLPLVGAAVVQCVSGIERKARVCLAATAATLVCSMVPWALLSADAGVHDGLWTFRGQPLFGVDGLSAPLLPATALMHFLIVLSTAKTKLPRLSCGWLLISETTRLGIFACRSPWPLIAMLAFSAIPPYVELIERRRPTRVYVLHMALFVILMVAGWIFIEQGYQLGSVLLLMAILLRSGTIPMHLWVADLFEHASFAMALLFITPIAGVYTAIRLVLPVAPDWVLSSLGVFSIVTAVYAAGMAIVQREARRFYSYLILSHSSLVMLGLELHTAISLTGALCLWYSVMLSLGGLGLTLRAVEARYRRLSLADHHGLYELSPALAICFLVTGLASVGFPGTLGYISTELLVDGAVGANLWVGIGVVLAGTLNSIAVLRAYLRLFTGTKAVSPVTLGMFPRERFAVLLLTAVIIGGGLFPQPGIDDRFAVAERLLETRAIESKSLQEKARIEALPPPAGSDTVREAQTTPSPRALDDERPSRS